MSHHPERTARNVRPVNQPPSKYNPHCAIKTSLKNFSDSNTVCSLPLYALGGRIRTEIGW